MKTTMPIIRVPEKRFFVEHFRRRLGQGRVTASSLRQALQAEGMWNNANSRQLEKAVRRTARWLNVESNNPDRQRRILHYFMDRQRDNLILIPNKDDIREMVEEALKDTKVPDGYREAGSYDFGEAVYFLNLDAEGRPASRLMRQTVPFFHRLVNGREVPPPQSLLGRIAARLFGRDNPPQIGFLQMPQFYTIDRQIGDPLQTVAHTDQRLFYANIQPSKSIGQGAFSCGAGALYDIGIKRELGHVEFNDPENPNKPQAPGGWSYELTAAEVEYQTRHHGGTHHVIAYQPQKSPTEDHAHSAMGALRAMGAKNGERGIFQDEVLNKGESPKDVGNLLGKQHPKWAGGTIGDFGYIILPAYLRWVPGASRIAQGIIWLLNNRAVRTLAWPVIKMFKGIDRVSQKIPVWKTLWNNLIKAPARYSEIFTWEVAMSHKGKLNPFSKTGREFFRSGTWYFRGLRDLILMSAPVLLVSSIFTSALIGSIITGMFTPIVLNPLLFLAVFVPYLIFSVGSYIHHSKRYGLSFKEIFLQKEAVFLGLGWPAYLHADLWGLRGPSGRLGATTTKGVGGREALPNLYWIPTAVVGGLSLLNVGIGSWLFANTAYYLGWAVALSGPGLGILFCSFWALYHAYMIYRGFKVSQHFKIKKEG